MQIRDTLLKIDETLYPENETLPAKRLLIDREIKDKLRPIDLGPNRQLQQIRNGFIDWKNTLILEGFPATNQTSCVEFWQFVKGYQDKYKSNKGNGTTEQV